MRCEYYKILLTASEMKKIGSPYGIFEKDYLQDFPPRPAHLFGREDELDILLDYLRSGDLTGLCGPAGVGKTALAGEAVHLVTQGEEGYPPEYSDGIFYHNFYDQPESDLVFERILRIFGVDPLPSLALAGKRALDGKRLLIVLDGVERAENLEQILEACVSSNVLLIGQKLEQKVENKIDLCPLEEQEASCVLKDWLREAASIEAKESLLCELVGGLPLALIVVGNYLTSYKEEGDKFIDWLSSTSLQKMDIAERCEKSVEVILERILSQLDIVARDTLAVVSQLAQQSFDHTLVATALEIEAPEASRVLSELVRVGILERVGDNSQFIHPLVKDYEGFNQKVPEGAFKRVASYFEGTIRAEREGNWAGIRHLDEIRPHIMALMEKLEEEKFYRAALSLAWVFEDYLQQKGSWTDRIRVCQTALYATRYLKDVRNEGIWLTKSGLAHWMLGNTAETIHFYEQALAINREIGDRFRECQDLSNLGNAYFSIGEFEKSIWYYELALVIAQETGDRQFEGDSLNNLGNAYRASRQLGQAIEFYIQSLSIAKEVSDRDTESNRHVNLGLVYSDSGDYPQAITSYKAALAIREEMGDRKSAGDILSKMGMIYRTQGQTEQAIEYFQKALSLARDTDDQRAEGAHLGNLGLAQRDLGNLRRAVEYYQQGLEIAKKLGDRFGEANRLGNLGNAFFSLGKVGEAVDYYQKAIQISQETGDQRGMGVHLGNLGLAYRAMNQVDQAIECYQQALIIARENGDRRSEGNHLGNLGNAYINLGQIEMARTYLTQALEIFKSIHSPYAEQVEKDLETLPAN